MDAPGLNGIVIGANFFQIVSLFPNLPLLTRLLPRAPLRSMCNHHHNDVDNIGARAGYSGDKLFVLGPTVWIV
jgi:hypothetical protein